MSTPDHRTNAFRPDLADVALRTAVTAQRYVEPVMKQCIRGTVPLLTAPYEFAPRCSEIKYGEFIDVIELREDGFAWVQNRSDRYVGYISASGTMSDEISALSHRVRVPHTFVYSAADIHSPIMDSLTLGSYVHVVVENEKFLALGSGGYIFTHHVAPTMDMLVRDYACTAGQMLGVPYLWGGRTPMGIDCSGLVQLALELAGFDCPRDSDQQMAAFGQSLPVHWRDVAWHRGDLVFFLDPTKKNHVGIVADAYNIIHATENVMLVTSEPLSDVVERGYEIIAVGRPTQVED